MAPLLDATMPPTPQPTMTGAPMATPESADYDKEIARRTAALEASHAFAQEAANNPRIKELLNRERVLLPPTTADDFLISAVRSLIEDD